jgi:hypothetical protein
MSTPAERATPTGRHASRTVRPGLAPGAFGGALAILIASAALGLVGGLVWAALAPRALYVVVGRGSADVVNPETTAFIAADAWFCLIGAAGGLIIGLAGYLLAVRRYGPVPMGAILAGGFGAGIAARWIGQRQGLGHFDKQLLNSHQGTLLHAPLALAGDASAALWPARGSFPAVAFWPLAAGAVAGGIMLVIAIRERRAARLYAGPLPEPGFRAYPR